MHIFCSALSQAMYNRNLGHHLTWLVNLSMDVFDWPFSRFVGAQRCIKIVCEQFALSWRVQPMAWSPTNGAVIPLLWAIRTYLRLRGRWMFAEQSLRPTSFRMCVLEANMLVQQHRYCNPNIYYRSVFLPSKGHGARYGKHGASHSYALTIDLANLHTLSCMIWYAFRYFLVFHGKKRTNRWSLISPTIFPCQLHDEWL